MKLLILVCVFLFGNICYSQSDTIKLYTPAKFSISFFQPKKSLFGLNQTNKYEEVYLDVLTKDFILIRKKYDDPKNPKAISRYYKVPLKDVKSVGYATGTQEVYSALIGLGSGALGGLLVTSLGKSFNDGDARFNPGGNETIAKGMLAGAISGAILGYIIGGYSNAYENFDLRNFDNEKKFEEIQKIVIKGMHNIKEK